MLEINGRKEQKKRNGKIRTCRRKEAGPSRAVTRAGQEGMQQHSLGRAECQGMWWKGVCLDKGQGSQGLRVSP